MFFTVPFPDLFAVAHSQWDDRNTWCKLRIFTARGTAEKLLCTLSEDEAVALGKHLVVLRQSGMEAAIEVEGDPALSLSSFVAAYANSVAEYKHIPLGPELLGFWEPPEKRKPGAGIIMWFDPDDDYHVVIVRSKEQAERVVKELHWLERERQELLLKKILNWNAVRRLASVPQRIDGTSAELLCRASIIQKALSSSRSGAH